MLTARQNSAPVLNCNKATHVLASTLGVLVGIGSVEHGVLECMQGLAPTPGLFVNALGRGYSWTTWKEGGEGAFTVLPNFLSSGITAGLLGVFMIAWALCGLRSRYGPSLFLCLGAMSFVTGGGVAQAVLILLTFSVAKEIHSPLAFWRRVFPRQFLKTLGRFWAYTLITSVALFLVALEIAIFGYIPGVANPVTLLHACWTVIAAALAIYIISVSSGFAHDAAKAD
jgi:hypothetical protein